MQGLIIRVHDQLPEARSAFGEVDPGNPGLGIICLQCLQGCPDQALKINDLPQSFLSKMEKDGETAQTLKPKMQDIPVSAPESSLLRIQAEQILQAILVGAMAGRCFRALKDHPELVPALR